MKSTWLILAGIFTLSLPLFAQEEATKEEATTALKEFKASLKTVQAESDITDALNTLGEVQHDKVLAELKKWLLGNGSIVRGVALKEIRSGGMATTREEVQAALNASIRNVRFTAAENVAKYKENKKAADSLIGAVRAAKNDPETQEKFIECATLTEYNKIDKKVCALFNDRNVGVARAAVYGTTNLKTKVCISALIKLVNSLEGISEDATGAGAPPMPGPGGVGGGQENEQIKRKRALLSTAKQALKDITGERYNTGRDWTGRDWTLWWRKNASKYAEPK